MMIKKVKINNLIVFLMFLICNLTLNAQKKILLKNANISFEKLAYADAIKDYEAYLKKNEGSVEIYKNLGDCYFYNSQFEPAALNFSKLIKSKGEVIISPEYYFKAAISNKYLEKYDVADQMMKILGSF